MSKVKIMARYNPALDLTALALDLVRSGRTRMAAKVFLKAASLPSTEAAIRTLNATNQLAREATKAAALKAKAKPRKAVKADIEEEDVDLTDDQIEQILEGDFEDEDDVMESVDIDLEADEDDDEDDVDDDADEGDDEDDEDLDADLDLDLDEDEEFAKVVASMRARSARLNFGRRSRR